MDGFLLPSHLWSFGILSFTPLYPCTRVNLVLLRKLEILPLPHAVVRQGALVTMYTCYCSPLGPPFLTT